MIRKDIFLAIEKNDIEYVTQVILEQNFNINEQDDIGFTVLHLAASKGKLEFVQFLVSNNADCNIKTKHGSTPLIAATASCLRNGPSDSYVEIVTLLLEKSLEDKSNEILGKISAINLLSQHLSDKIISLFIKMFFGPSSALEIKKTIIKALSQAETIPLETLKSVVYLVKNAQKDENRDIKTIASKILNMIEEKYPQQDISISSNKEEIHFQNEQSQNKGFFANGFRLFNYLTQSPKEEEKKPLIEKKLN